MFLRPCYRKKNGKRHAYWALVESYRTARGPRQRIVAYLGQLEEPKRRGVKHAAGQADPPSLFDPADAEYVEVDVKRVRVDRCLDFGGPWLGLQILQKLDLPDFLDEIMPPGREDVPWPMMAAVLVLCRLCQPSSELHIAEHLYKHTAIADLLGVPAEKINEDRLYRALDRILEHKDALQIFLKNRLGSLFDLEIRPAAVRRDQHVLRGPGQGQPQGPARLQPRQDGATASRSASAWSSPRKACRWATKSSPATAAT